MFNKFLSRLPNEDHIGYWISFDNNTQTYTETGEQFSFAFDTDDVNAMETTMGQTFIDVSLPMEITTSSEIDFKIGDRIVFFDKVKLITNVASLYTNDNITVAIGFNPQVKRYYTRLTLS
jgi:hypothetical protein